MPLPLFPLSFAVSIPLLFAVLPQTCGIFSPSRERRSSLLFLHFFFQNKKKRKKKRPKWLLPRTSASCRFVLVLVLQICRVWTLAFASRRKEKEKERAAGERRREERQMKRGLTANGSPLLPFRFSLSLTLSHHPKSFTTSSSSTHRRSARSRGKEAARWPLKPWR